MDSVLISLETHLCSFLGPFLEWPSPKLLAMYARLYDFLSCYLFGIVANVSGVDVFGFWVLMDLSASSFTIFSIRCKHRAGAILSP